MTRANRMFNGRSGTAAGRRLAALVACGGCGAALCAAQAAGAKSGAKKGDWLMWGGAPDRNMVSDETGIPAEWDVKSGRNIKWKAPLGSQTYGNVVVADGKVLVGTNNGGEFRPKVKGDKGIMLCFAAEDGKLLWQASHDKLPTGQVNDWPEQGICSSPAVVGDRAYYVNNRCELVCVDLNGFHDDENDGPLTDEPLNEKQDADFVWKLDMIEELGVFPHNLATSSPVVADDRIFLLTSNGVDEGHLNLPAPQAAAFICVDRNTGEVQWVRNDPGKNTLHGQWSSPAYGVIGGVPQVIFAGGDGWVYSFKPENGEPLWKYNLNPADAKYVLGGKGTKSYIIATPVIFEDRVYNCVGQDPEHGEGIGQFHCIDATKRGDITESGKVWHVGGKAFNRSMSTPAIRDGLVYAADLSGFLHCLDADTGQEYWKHDTFAAIWGSPYYVDGKVMLGDEEGEVVVLQPGQEMKVLATNEMGSAVYTTPVAAHGVLYISTQNMLYAIEQAK